jgi:tight adherence protein C
VIDFDSPSFLAIVYLMAGLSLFGLVMAWPSAPRRQASTRILRPSGGRKKGGIAGEPANGSATLAPAGQIYRTLYRALRLESQAKDGDMLSRLRMAGCRGRGPAIVFLVARSLAPLAAGAVAALYVFGLLSLPYPAPVKATLIFAAALAGYYAPAVYLRNRIIKRQASIRNAWPDALDLLLICIGSGMSIEMALRRVASEIGGQSAELADELALVTAELSYVSERRSVFDGLARRTGLEEIKAAATALVQADQHGTSLGDTVRVLAQESRDARMTEAERRANALPPKLTVPMIVFFLPVLLAVVITPAAIQVIGLI